VSADALLSHLQGVRRTGDGRWLARCPSHEDKRPSLAVRELTDGRVLVHCFAGCGAGDVIGAVGMSFEELFPPRPLEHGPRVRGAGAYPAADVLRALADELGVIAIIAADLRHGRPVTSEDFSRLELAADRVRAARALALGQ
jgi:hypothetical protein